jgi:tetratricopeptide (TPR) repeat protein
MHQLAKVVVAAVLIVGGGAWASARADEPAWVGRRVFVRPGAVLKIGRHVVDDSARQSRAARNGSALLRVYRVEHVNGPWLWLVPEHEGVRGWTKTYQVVPYDQAIGHFSGEIRSSPRDPLGYLRRGSVRQDQGDFSGAIADLDEAIRLDPDSALAYYQRGLARHAEADHSGAHRDFDAALRLDPEDALAHNSRAHARQASGDLSRAITDYDAVIRLDPRNATAYCSRGLCRQRKGELEQALADFDESIRLDSGGVAAHLNRGRVQEALGRFDQAIADYDATIRLDPGNASAYNARGHLEKRRGEYSKAIADYEEAIRLDPEDPAPYNNRAWLWATCRAAEFRDGPRAVASATRACELGGWKEPDNLETLAAACAEASDFDAAVSWEEKAIELYPDESDRGLARSRLALYQAKKPLHEGPPGP